MSTASMKLHRMSMRHRGLWNSLRFAGSSSSSLPSSSSSWRGMASYAKRLMRERAVKISHAPESISAIPDEGLLDEDDYVGAGKRRPGAFVRAVGCTRRVFLLNPYLTPDEMEGLAYRIKTLSRNGSINSVLVATSGHDDVKASCLPGSVLQSPLDAATVTGEYRPFHDENYPPSPGKTWYVSGGYDPMELYRSGHHRDPDAVESVLTKLGQLAMSNRGDFETTKVPVISVPHGAMTDGGYAFCMGSYVIATPETGYRILNPSKGLSFDPVGLSFFLPRLGREFNQPSAEYAGCGLIMALTGYEANASDMLLTGMATHTVPSADGIGHLEYTLSQLRPWDQQALINDPVRFQGDPVPDVDHNGMFRNVSVASVVHCHSESSATGSSFWIHDEAHELESYDFSSDPDLPSIFGTTESDLVVYASTFDEIFKTETTVGGIYERFREIAGRVTRDPEEQEGIDVAKEFVRGMDNQSPLALSVVHRLMQIGSREDETLESCMEREKLVQAKMYGLQDFDYWAAVQYGLSMSNEGAPESPPATSAKGWKHATFADVTEDEVAEIVES